MRKMLRTIAGLVAFVVAIGIWQATPLRVWWGLRELRQASSDDRDRVAASFKALGESAVGPLLEGWKSTDADDTCRLSTLALAAVASAFDEPATTRTLGAIRRGFDGFSVDGKRAALAWSAEIVSKPGELSAAVDEIVNELAAKAEKTRELQTSRLLLAGSLVGRSERWTTAGRTLALAALGLWTATISRAGRSWCMPSRGSTIRSVRPLSARLQARYRPERIIFQYQPELGHFLAFSRHPAPVLRPRQAGAALTCSVR